VTMGHIWFLVSHCMRCKHRTHMITQSFSPSSLQFVGAAGAE
jgi:hypothetical protein